MWLLINRTDPGKVFTLVGGKKYVVGRQNCDITIPDASVSRCQAELTVVHHENNVMKSFVLPTLTLHDVSKFGTFVNGKSVRATASQEVTLQEGDEIKFGGNPVSVFSVSYQPFIMTTSCIEKAPKKDLIRAMCLLGGHLVRDWRHNCEMLIMSKINVTIKVVCALNSQKHIVTPNYLEDLYDYHLGKKEKPDPRQYLPEVVDQEVPPGVSFHPDERRVTLLTGLKVYFLSAVQFNKTNLAVSTAGGQPILLEDGTEEDAETMTQPNTIVISVSRDIVATLSPSCQKFVKLVYSTLASKGLRMVSDPEVGWAILTCNIDKFCNPMSEITPSMYADVASQMTQLSSSQMAEEVTVGKRSFADHIEDSSMEESLKISSKRLKTETDNGNSSPQSNTSSHQTRTIKSSTDPPQLNTAVATTVANTSSSSKNSTSSDSKTTSSDSKTNLQVKKDTSEKPKAKNRTENDFSFPQNEDSDENDNSLSLSKVKKSGTSRLSTDLFSEQSEAVENVQKSSLNISSSKVVEAKVLPNTEINDEQSQPVSVFAKKQDPKPKSKGINFDNSDDEEESVRKKVKMGSNKRKAVFAFDDEDNDINNIGHSNVCKKQATGKQRKAFSDDLSETGNGEMDESAQDSTRTPGSVTKNGQSKRQVETDSNIQSGDTNDSPNPTNTRVTNGKMNNTHTNPNSNPVSESSSSRFNNIQTVSETNSKSPVQETAGTSGWLGVKSQVKCKPEPVNDAENGLPENSEVAAASQLDGTGVDDDDNKVGDVEMKDVKPVLDSGSELLLDSQGRPIKHFCEVKVVDLLARPIGSKRQQPEQQLPATKGLKNFKKFKKTKHVGSDGLPNIIGGRDLEVHSGDRNRDIEQLFSLELDEQKKKEDEERQSKQLFDWDGGKSRKTTKKGR